MNHSKPCVFCGATRGLSKEHFWPEWLSSYLPPAVPNSHITELHSGEGKQPQRLERQSQRPGAVKTKKIRAVCAACNNGWMSTVEAQVKPIVLALLDRSRTTLLESDIRSLANTALTVPDDRHAVRRGSVPTYFRIFAAFHTLEAKTAYYRHSTTISLSRDGPVPTLPRTISRNIQLTSFLMGPVCFYVTAARVDQFNGAVLDPAHAMHRLWPDPQVSIDMTALQPLGQAEIATACRSLERLVRDPRVIYGGPLRR